MSDYVHSLFDQLNTYAQSDFYPFHMPGHKRNVFAETVSPESIDITEITCFDDLHHPEGILKEAQERMADVFGAHKSFFLVNGSTAGILAAICACTKKGGRILMARNCHKSVYHAALLQELAIDYLYPDVTEYGIAGSILPEMVSQKLSEAKTLEVPYQAIVITSPTYDGIVSDITAIADIAHAYHIPLIVDEAHGAHFGFSDGFPKKAHTLGADIVIESIHKTLPALTQSAALHIADSPYINEARIKQYLSIFQTSSPSYVLMAGLDQCTQLLQARSSELFSSFEKKLTAFYEKAASLKNISVLYADDVSIFQKDPSKILISADKLGMTGGELFAILRDNYHLELEMASLHYVTALTSVMDTQKGFDRLISALEEIDRMAFADSKDIISNSKTTSTTPGFFLHIILNQKMPIPLYEATSLPHEAASHNVAPGKICADFIIPYPPGIPLLVPGEQITEEHMEQISRCLKDGITVYGIL